MKALKSGSSHLITVLIGALLGIAATSAMGQALYRCKSGTRTYLTDRPCGPGADTKITSFGPEREPPSRPSYTPPLRKAPDHLRYLSPQCAELNDAIRTAPARGVGRDTQSELREEYGNKCQEDESAAQRQLRQDQRRQRDEREAQISSAQAEKARSTAERDQCNELLRILHQKRKRLDSMTEGERADHQRFETNYAERCK